MKTCLYKPVFVNPQAYFVFPQLYDMQPKTDNFVEQAIFTGRLIITDLTNNQYTSYQNVNTIDFSQYADKRIKIEQYTDTGAVVLGEWIISQDTTGVKPIASYRAYDKTNDDTDRDILKDLTGNGHDIQLYNFAFAESSGYGKYATDFSKWIKYNSEVYKNKFISYGAESNFILRNINSYNELNVKITGINNRLQYRYCNNSITTNIEIIKDGIYTLKSSDGTGNAGFVMFEIQDNPITIEQIPDYQGALVSDGVDDYGLCENFPVFTPEKGFTICAIREYISDKIGCLVTNHISNTISNFMFEATNAEYKSTCLSFNKRTSITIEKQKFSYMTSNKYNDNTIAKGNDVATIDKIRLFSYYAHNNNFVYNAALYALEIYDRDLTDEEIATVKARMIAEYEEKTGNKYEEETV